MNRLNYVTGASESYAVTPREAQNRVLSREAAQEGIVLLRNENGTLPLMTGKIALYGAGAVRTVKGGTGSGEVNERYTVTILEGLKNAGFTITTQQWLDDYEETFTQAKQAYAETVKLRLTNLSSIINAMSNPMLYPAGRVISDEDIAQSDTDTAIYVVARQAGEGADRKLDRNEYHLMPEEIESLRKMASSYEKSILVINAGAQMDLSVLDETDLSAVIWFCQQGEEGGNALADILTGAVNPSGKLTDTWVMQYSDIPFSDEYSYLSGDTTKEYYKEGIYVGYRYFDTFGVPVRYPFGYGLSYTSFGIRTMDVSFRERTLTFRINVKNTGTAAGKEVVQIYAALPEGRLDKESMRLCAFAKTQLLMPAQEQNLTVCVCADDLYSYDEVIAARLLESGDYVFLVGNSSADAVPAAVLHVPQEQVIAYLKNVHAPDQKICALTAPPREAITADASSPRFVPEVCDPVKVHYESPIPCTRSDVTEILDALTDEELTLVCTGGGMNACGKAMKISAPSAAGKTTDRLYGKGLIGVNLADGPAGIRISRSLSIGKNGSIRGGEYILSFMEYMPALLQKRMLADPQKDEMRYQLCTAFPVGTALAQTWNTELCERVGAAVSAEMDEYNITYWLAPAMNIHRNPLCGRNFEYFSEDPLVSGRIAAAIVRGVQSVPGCYAVIKHFAANNQEDNRNHSDSIVDERALRELYLRGFEICVREAQPAAVMSSYNLINGIYAPNCRDLLTDVLRCEWGFDGIVMTDWFSTGQGLGRNDLAISAGNDLIMPGMEADRSQMRKGLKSGTLSREALKVSASRIIRQILDSNMAIRYTPEMFEKPKTAVVAPTVNIRRESFICHRGMLKIRGNIYRPADGENLPIAIVSHGFMSTGKSCAAYAKTLAQCGYAAFIFDFCGGSMHSRSQGDTCDMSVLTEVKDLKAVITYAQNRDDTDASHLLLAGCSQGGFVSALTAAQMPDAVEGLIMLYPALSIPDDARKGSMIAARFDPQNIPETFSCGPMKLGRAYAADVINMDAYEQIIGYTGMVLIVHGDGDRLVDVSCSRRAASAYKAAGADVRLKVIEGADHGFTNPLHLRKARGLVGTFAKHLQLHQKQA